MGVEGKAVRMSAGEVGCTYAALILHDDGLEVNEENIKKLITAAKVECDSYWPVRQVPRWQHGRAHLLARRWWLRRCCCRRSGFRWWCCGWRGSQRGVVRRG